MKLSDHISTSSTKFTLIKEEEEEEFTDNQIKVTHHFYFQYRYKRYKNHFSYKRYKNHFLTFLIHQMWKNIDADQ